MPDLAMALLALHPPTDSGVWLDAPPKPGTVVRAPLVVSGETQALEGVLKVSFYVVRGTSVRLVETYEPALPVGPIPFTFALDPAGMRPGRVTVRVVATTLARGFRAEATDLVIPGARRVTARPAEPPPVARPAAPARAVRPAPSRRTTTVAMPQVDDSGRAFGKAAPTLPYVRRAATPRRAPVARPVASAPVALPADRSGWASVAGGLLLMVVCSHLHRALRTQPDPRDGR
ncbi:MAG TPA: hypothetical protein VNQ77_03760 [Frankiaceae bacterium]|nr:hypothetical protein [Frankiaceae bacterium]